MSFRHLLRLPPDQISKAQRANSYLERLWSCLQVVTSHDQEPTFASPIQILKQKAFEAAEGPELRRGSRRYWHWQNGLDWPKLESICLRLDWKLLWAAITVQEIMRVLAMGTHCRVGRCFVSADYSAWFRQVIFMDSCIATCAVGHWIRWSRWPACSSVESVSCLNYHLFTRPV